MSNFAAAMKTEVSRLARKEVRSETEPLKKTSAQYRSDLAGLKRRVVELERLLGQLAKKSAHSLPPSPQPEDAKRLRFSAARLTAQRQKLGISAQDMGSLVGVSAQTIYNWEAGKTRPKPQQLVAIAAVRALGKRQLAAKLADPGAEL